MPTYFIKTFGCQMNVSDSERIAGFLELQKIKPIGKIEKADLVIFNTCGVRQMAEDRAYGQIHNIRKRELVNNGQKRKTIILTGCLANRRDVQRRLKDKVALFFPINDFNKFENWIIENYLKIVPSTRDCKLKIPAQQDDTLCSNYLSISPKYNNPHSALVPVMTGCNNFCSYCVVPYARGREISRPATEIFEEIEKLSQQGCQEITLLGQNVNSYHGTWNMEHETKKIKFFELINKLAKTFPQITFKFLTSHPKDFSDQLMTVIAKNPNISKEIHLPIQSGSDKILKAMNRPYTQKHYLSLIEKARKIIPAVRFTTDVIVGFPGETKKDLEETAKVLKKVGYNLVFINKYSPRPGTASFKLEDSVTWDEKKRREEYLKKILKNQT